MTKLRILQLSDIHNVACPRAMDDFKTMRRELLKDIKDYCEHYVCKFDAVLICGDIAFSGKMMNMRSQRHLLMKSVKM